MPSVERSKAIRYSVTDASERGIARIIREAESGLDVILTRHGTDAAVVLGIERYRALLELEEDLQDVALILLRSSPDRHATISLDDAITAFGFSRRELEAQIAAEETLERRRRAARRSRGPS
jgi:prevent-host-death family protein